VTTHYDVAAYYFPNYHHDARTEQERGTSYSEWDDVRAAKPRFPGHKQPKVPAWGYEDESDPAIMARKIDAAADHGLTTFLFDWYWDEEGPRLQRALEDGFLRAPNNERLRFALMWANHWPISRQAFDRAADYVTRTYLGHPSYQRIEGGLHVSIYETLTLIEGLGGVDAARDALEGFRRTVREATGQPLHLNAVLWGVQMRPARPIDEQNRLLRELGYDSTSSYVWVHHTPLPEFPATDCAAYAKVAIGQWERYGREIHLPYYPNVTVGWDPSPRTDQSRPLQNGGYPNTAVLTDNEPAQFGRALEAAKGYLDRHPALYPLVTLYAWNEWAEGGYLEPDTTHGMAYLEEIKRVFA
jgi:hypothetical protein